MSHQLPDPPDGWTVATNIEKHISLLYDDGRSIVVKPFGPREAGRWKVIGVAQYAPDSPVFCRNETLSDAISTAVGVMQTIADGDADEIEPVGTVGAEIPGEQGDKDGDDIQPPESNADNTDDQAALQDFA